MRSAFAILTMLLCVQVCAAVRQVAIKADAREAHLFNRHIFGVNAWFGSNTIIYDHPDLAGNKNTNKGKSGNKKKQEFIRD